jgi:16S rRNA (adenine1518-N6/adenine1519-N6)-dimethyltransferase
LSVLLQIFLDLAVRFFIPPSAFFPRPKVESAVVHMGWKEKPMIGKEDEEWFKKVVKACFGYRRKTLLNGLKHSELSFPDSPESRMEKVGIDPRRRPETLTIEEFIRLAEALK